MKRIHTISSAMLAAAMLLATACSEELMDGDHTAANAVQIATATVGGDTPAQSRAAIDDTEFANGDAITLSTDAAGSAKYTYTKSDNGWTQTTPLYWGNTYPVTYYAAYPDNADVTYNAFTLPTDQSGTKIEVANYMTAKTDEISEKPANGSISLAFTHRTAQVIVKINKQHTAGNEGTLTNAKIYSPKSGYTDAKPSGNATEVIPFTATGTIEDDLDAQYTALVIPGLAANHKLFSIGVGNNILAYTTTVNFEANKIYTYTLTIGTDRVVLNGLTVKDWTTTEVSGTMLGYWEDYASTTLSGSGTADNPYLINSAADLAHLAKEGANKYNTKYFKLEKDLDLSGKLWTPIGRSNENDSSSPLWCNFDGDGHTITGLTVRTNGTYASGMFGPGYAAGLFGNLYNSTVSNLHLTDVDVRGDYYAGGLCGSMSNSLIYGCTVDGKVSGATHVGGLVGDIDNSDNYLFACGTRCTVVATTSGTNAGGLVGYARTLSVASSYASGTVSGVDGSTVRPLFGGYYISLSSKWCASTQAGEINASNDTGSETGVADFAALKAIIDPATQGSFTLRQYDFSTSAFAGKRFFTDAANWEDKIANTDRCPWLPGTIAAPADYDVLEIDTKQQLMQFAKDVNEGNTVASKVVLTADIDLAGVEWTPIGNDASHSMKSSFDGQGHTISNLTMNTDAIQYAGLFGYVGNSTKSVTIKNVTLENANVSSTQSSAYAGALIGYVQAQSSCIAIIDNCHVTGTSTVTGCDRAGGLVGRGSFCIVTRCSSVANVTTTGQSGYTGGLIGQAGNSSIYACYSTGNVSSTGTYVPGGIIGYSNVDTYSYNVVKGNISGCYYNGASLTQNESAAGGRIVGSINTKMTDNTTTLSYCGAPAISGLKFFDSNAGSGTFTYIQLNNQDVNDGSGVEVSGLYGVVANQTNTATFTVDGTTYNVKDCWTDNGSSAPTLKVKMDGSTD